MLFFAHLVELPPHETLDGKNRILRIRHRLPLGCLTDEPLAILCKRHDRGRRARAFGIFEDDRFAAFHDRHAGVGGSQVDA